MHEPARVGVGRTVEAQAHIARVRQWPAQHLRGEPKLIWEILFELNGYDLGLHRLSITPAYVGALIGAADPVDAGKRYLANLRRVQLIETRELDKVCRLWLLETQAAFTHWSQEIGLAAEDPQPPLPFPEDAAAADAEASTDGATPVMAVMTPHAGDSSGGARERPLRQDAPAGISPGISDGISRGISPAPRARASSESSESSASAARTSVISHRKSSSSVTNREARLARAPGGRREIPGDIPATFAAAAAEAVAEIVDEADYTAQYTARREEVLAWIKRAVADAKLRDAPVVKVAAAVADGRLDISHVARLLDEIQARRRELYKPGAYFVRSAQELFQQRGIRWE